MLSHGLLGGSWPSVSHRRAALPNPVTPVDRPRVGDLFGHTEPIKAVSFWQPWAALVAVGVKLHDTRHWSTDYRGPIAIHATKTVDVAGAPEALCQAALGADWWETVPRGAIIAVGVLTACVDASSIRRELTPADIEAGNFTPGRFAWRIDRVRALKAPIAAVGRQALFNWPAPADLEDRLGPVLDHEAACARIGWGFPKAMARA